MNGAGRWLALAGGIAIGVVPFVTKQKLGREQIQRWIRLRSVSEGLKSELYRYLTRVGPYAGTDRDQKLLDASLRLREDVADLSTEVQEAMASHRPLPEVTGVDSYLAYRVRDQIENYYRPRSKEYVRRLRLLQRLEFVVGLGAVMVGAVAAGLANEAVAAWVPVLTTIGVALLTHASTSRYQEDALAFARTADRLSYLRDSWSAARTSDKPWTDAELVDACEDAISIENQGWMAKWSALDGSDTSPKVGS